MINWEPIVVVAMFWGLAILALVIGNKTMGLTTACVALSLTLILVLVGGLDYFLVPMLAPVGLR